MKKGAGFCGKNYNSPIFGLSKTKEVKAVEENNKEHQPIDLASIISQEELSLLDINKVKRDSQEITWNNIAAEKKSQPGRE